MDKWLNQIHQGDCIQLLEEMPAESIDIVVTSPPYNIKNSSGGFWNSSSFKWPNSRLLHEGYSGHDDYMQHDDYVDWQRAVLSNLMRVLKPTGAIFYNHKWRVQKGVLQDRADIVSGFPVRQVIIWQRKGGINFNPGYFLPTYEVVYMIAKPAFKLLEKANVIGDVWSITQDRGNPHPASFPIELPKRCIESSPGPVVLDPFIGSGTTAIAAMIAGRDWIGIDNSEEYCDMARKRIETYLEAS